MIAVITLTLVLTGGFSFVRLIFDGGLGFEMRNSRTVTRVCTAAVIIQRYGIL